jgi:hypothetical protein
MGKATYSDEGQKVNKLEDLIISPERRVSYVNVCAGGFIGTGRRDVGIPGTQVQDKAGKWVMLGATKDLLKAVPEFACVFANQSMLLSADSQTSPRPERASLKLRL